MSVDAAAMEAELAAFKDPKLARGLIDSIQKLAPADGATLMEVCGTHTVAIARNGIRALMPEGVKLSSGPGCPVCVTSNHDIDAVIALARVPEVTIATFGDMTRVPGSTSSLLAEQAAGRDVRIVYSPLDALALAQNNPDRQIVFVGVGFETTTPLSAMAIKRAKALGLKNFSVLAIHKNMPNALEVIVNDPQLKLDALILPGHVSTIIGAEPYRFLAERYGVPGVITGFEAVDVLQGIAMIMRQLHEGRGGQPRRARRHRRGVRGVPGDVARFGRDPRIGLPHPRRVRRVRRAAALPTRRGAHAGAQGLPLRRCPAGRHAAERVPAVP